METVVQQTKAYMGKFGGYYSDWYAGIAADAKDRLFRGHSVSETGGAWIFHDCGTDTTARQVEDYFLKLGCKGGPGGGNVDAQSKYFYAYKITPQTRE